MDVCTYPKAPASVPKSVAKSSSERQPVEHVRLSLGSGRQLMPTVDAVALRHYFHYLSKNLSLPFPAWYPEPTLVDEDGEYPCLVMELIDPASGLGDEIDGVFCKVRKGQYERNLPLIEMELPPDDPNYQVVERYWDSFWHRR